MQNRTVLVTGGTGFVGIHTILQLLQQGYKVKTTLRSLSKKDSIIKALKDGGLTGFGPPFFFRSRSDSRCWLERGCKGL